VGRSAPDRIREIFDIVVRSRDAGIEKVTSTIALGKHLAGWEVDRAARDVLDAAGYAKYLNNRVGHSIGQEVHGNGANMDNFESHDERELLPNTCFSIEPGIYLPEFGLRSEVNMLVRRVVGCFENHALVLFRLIAMAANNIVLSETATANSVHLSQLFPMPPSLKT
jgi:Xaa-Pro aminopeptidase